jgi:hypothetical protein
MTLNTVPSVQHRNAEGEAIDNPKLALIEAICISWFTIEYLLRFAGKYSNVSRSLISCTCIVYLQTYHLPNTITQKGNLGPNNSFKNIC